VVAALYVKRAHIAFAYFKEWLTPGVGVKATTLVLLKAGARPDRADDAGKTALNIAEEEGNAKLIDLLLEWTPARGPTPEPEAHPIESDAGELHI